MTKQQYRKLQVGDPVVFRYGNRSAKLKVTAIHRRHETLDVKHFGLGAEFIGYNYKEILKKR